MATTIYGEIKRLLRVKVVTELPEQGVPNKIYFVLNSDSAEDNRYDEYLWVKDEEHPDGYFEKVGYKYVDLTPYYTKTEVDALLLTKVDVTTYEAFEASITALINAHINNTENPHNVTKAQVGLSEVDNTSDINKPISTAVQEALDNLDTTLMDSVNTVKDGLNSHILNTNNPHNVTAEQIGLGNVENKSAATIISEITANNITTALGFTPYTKEETDNAISVAISNAITTTLNTNV